MFFNKEMETMSRQNIERLQLERLKYTVDYCIKNVKFYHDRLTPLKISGERIKTLSDLQYIPFTTKDDIKKNYPFGMFAVPQKEIVRVHGSSGTTGKPTIVGYTKNDLNVWSDLIARLACAVDVTSEDIAQISFGYGLFTGGFGLHYGLEKIGCMVVPASAGNTQRQFMFMKDFQTTVLIITPSYAVYMAEMMEELGIKREEIALRVAMMGGEGHTPEMRKRIEEKLGLIATDNYGMSELIGPGVSGECMERNGLHIAEDHFIPEIIDPDNEQVLGKGEKGEIVFTSLTKEAFPILRYRTRDISRLNYDPCKCGRTHVRMDKVYGRSDDMIIIKGVNVFPSQIESCIVGMEGIGPHYMITLRRENHLDNIEISVELIDGSLLENYKALEQLRGKIKDKLHSVLGLDARVKLVEPKTLERFQGKAKRVVDLRSQGQ